MNIKFFVTTACALTVVVSSGCAPAIYSAPAPSEPPETTITVGLSFDDVWSALIELLTVSFADIELLDRDSGFIRIDFAGNVDSYANCGTIQNALHPRGQKGVSPDPMPPALKDQGGSTRASTFGRVL